MIRIITDSAADLTPAEYEKLNITCIPLTVMFGQDEYRENVNLSKDQFYDLLLHSGHTPKTAQPSPQLLMDLFEEAHAAGDSAIYITLAAPLSGTHQSAVMTRNLLGYEDCYVVDGASATGGQRLVVQYAARLRDQGKSVEEILEGIASLRGRITLFACMDTLEYLYKGGRISHTVYKLGTMANIKPIISLEADGSVSIPAKAMGMRKGIDYQCKQVAAIAPDPDHPFYVMYTNNIQAARDLAKKLESQGIVTDDDHIIQVGAGIGSHIGPDACGLVYVAAK